MVVYLTRLVLAAFACAAVMLWCVWMCGSVGVWECICVGVWVCVCLCV